MVTQKLQNRNLIAPTPSTDGRLYLKILVDAIGTRETRTEPPTPEAYGPFQEAPTVDYEGHDYDANGMGLNYLVAVGSPPPLPTVNFGAGMGGTYLAAFQNFINGSAGQLTGSGFKNV